MYDMTPKTRRRYCPISISACVVAALVMFPAAMLGAEIVYHAALTVFLLAATTLITVRTGVNTEVLEAARQAGYTDGYEDGLSVAPAPPTELRRVI